MGELRIAVIGAGIGGLTAAVALQRAGLRCTVYEQAPELAEVGAGLQLAPNAVRQLHRIGLAAHLRRVAVAPRAIEMRRFDDGRVIMRTPLGEDCERAYGVPYYTVHRAHLHAGLAGALQPGTLLLNKRCVSIVERAGSVALRFADGTAAAADVVVGADGIHSVVRALLAADEPVFSGQSIYRGLLSADRLPLLGAGPAVRLWLGPGQHCVAYPVSAGRQVSFAATTPAGAWRAESWASRADPAELLAAYRDWDPEVRALLRAAGPVTRWALHDRAVLERWSTGRVTLLGDAAHPMLPFFAQGANQAIEDAAALAVCLRDGPADSAAALARYEAARIPRTTLVHQRSRGNTAMLHLPDGPQQRERDAALAAGSGLSTQDWLYGYDAELAVA